MTQVLLPILEDGCQTLGLQLDGAAMDVMCGYVNMLEKWNRAYNLTAVRDASAMVSYHLLDSLAILPWLGQGRILDVGTGAGLPGIPLAIACPQQDFTLLDSNGKKTRFLLQAVSELGLQNVSVLQDRAQHVVDKAGFDMVLSRAFATLHDMVSATDHLLAASGHWLAMKGIYPTDEMSQLPAGVKVEEVAAVAVPNLPAQRHIVLLQRASCGP